MRLRERMVRHWFRDAGAGTNARMLRDVEHHANFTEKIAGLLRDTKQLAIPFLNVDCREPLVTSKLERN